MVNDKNGDKKYVKKVMTYKSGKFVFSRKYYWTKVIGLVLDARVLLGSVQDIPVVPDIVSQIEDEIIKKSIFGTAAIEGNPLSEEDVAKVLDSKKIEEKNKRAQRQISNLKEAYEIIKGLKKAPDGAPFKLNEQFIKSIHKLLTEGSGEIDNVPGKYRKHDVKVGDRAHGGIYIPPKILKDVQTLMKEYVEWINSEGVCSEDPFVRAALAHYFFALIHPFGDGNGRTARIIEAILLKTSGVKYVPVMLSNYYYRNIDDYFIAFSRTEQQDDYDVGHFIEFFFEALISSLQEIKDKIYYFIRKTTVKTYYEYLRRKRKVTKRQYDLISFLLDYNKGFSVDELFNEKPLSIFYDDVKSDRTASRDVKQLCKYDLLYKSEEDGKYYLNLRVLDN